MQYTKPETVGLYGRRPYMRMLLILLALLAGQSLAIGGEVNFPLPPGALKPEHASLDESSEQELFWLKEPYPSIRAFDHYARVFSDWILCKRKEAGWNSYAVAPNNRYVHRFIRYWISKKDDEVILLVLEYSSKGLEPRQYPDNDLQLVVVGRSRVSSARAEVDQQHASICAELPH